MIALLTLIAALAEPPASPSPKPSPAVTSSPAPLPSDPEQLARQQFAAFATGNVDQRWYTVPIPAASIAQARAGLDSLGAPKSFTLLKTADTPYGKAYAYRVTCEKGAAIEQLSVQNGKITGILFQPG